MTNSQFQRACVWVFWLGVMAVFAYQYQARRQHLADQRSYEKQRLELMRQKINGMVSETGADTLWIGRLVPESGFRYGAVSTLEMQEAWLDGKPILFLGAMSDVADYDAGHYLVTIEPSMDSPLDYFTLNTELQLKLVAPKAGLGTTITEHPEILRNLGHGTNVAVIAMLETVTGEERTGNDGAHEQFRVGTGVMTSFVFVGDSPFPDN